MMSAENPCVCSHQKRYHSSPNGICYYGACGCPRYQDARTANTITKIIADAWVRQDQETYREFMAATTAVFEAQDMVTWANLDLEAALKAQTELLRDWQYQRLAEVIEDHNRTGGKTASDLGWS